MGNTESVGSIYIIVNLIIGHRDTDISRGSQCPSSQPISPFIFSSSASHPSWLVTHRDNHVPTTDRTTRCYIVRTQVAGFLHGYSTINSRGALRAKKYETSRSILRTGGHFCVCYFPDSVEQTLRRVIRSKKFITAIGIEACDATGHPQTGKISAPSEMADAHP